MRRKCVDDIVQTINKSASVNHTQLVGTQDGEVLVPTYDWLSFFGVQKLISCLKDHLYWPGHAKNWCNTCHMCATQKSPSPSRRAPVVSGFPLEKVAVDILGPLQSPKRVTNIS